MKIGIYDELESARLAIYGALADPTIIKILTPLGYDRKELLAGKVRYEKVLMHQDQKKGRLNSQKETTHGLREAYKEGYALYVRHVKLARLALEPNRKPWNDLNLSGMRKQSITGWLVQAKEFYSNMEPVKDQLLKQGITEAEIEQAKAMIEAVEASRVAQNHDRSHAQQAREQRDAVRADLRQWMRRYKKALRFAFDENRQQLEALGMVVPSKQV